MVAKHDNDALGSCDPHEINSIIGNLPNPVGRWLIPALRPRVSDLIRTAI